MKDGAVVYTAPLVSDAVEWWTVTGRTLELHVNGSMAVTWITARRGITRRVVFHNPCTCAPTALRAMDRIVEKLREAPPPHPRVDVAVVERDGEFFAAQARLCIDPEVARALAVRQWSPWLATIATVIQENRDVLFACDLRYRPTLSKAPRPGLRRCLVPHQRDLMAWMRSAEHKWVNMNSTLNGSCNVAIPGSGLWITCERNRPRGIAHEELTGMPCHVRGCCVFTGRNSGKTEVVQQLVLDTAAPAMECFADGDAYTARARRGASAWAYVTRASLVVVGKANVEEWAARARVLAPRASIVEVRNARDWCKLGLREMQDADIVVVSGAMLDGDTYQQKVRGVLAHLLGATRDADHRHFTIRRSVALGICGNDCVSPVPLEFMAWRRVVIEDAQVYHGDGMHPRMGSLPAGFVWIIGDATATQSYCYAMALLECDGMGIVPGARDAFLAECMYLGELPPARDVVVHPVTQTPGEIRHARERPVDPVVLETIGVPTVVPPPTPADTAVRDATRRVNENAASLAEAAERYRVTACEDHNSLGEMQRIGLVMDADRMDQRVRTRRSQLQHFTEAAVAAATVCPCCMDRPGNVMPLCGHGVCSDCAQRIFETPIRACPTCRGEMDADWLWHVQLPGVSQGEPTSGPPGSRANALLQVLRAAHRCLVWAPTDEIARMAFSAVKDYTECARVTGTATVRAAVLKRLSDPAPSTYAVFMTPTTSCGNIPVQSVTDVVIYAPLGARGRACAMAYTKLFGETTAPARVHELV